MAYLDIAGIDTGINAIAAAHPGLVSVVNLPEKSVKNRTIRVMRLRAGGGANRRGVLIVGGVHARELVNSEAVLNLALKITDAYAAGTGFSQGGASFTADQVRIAMEVLDIFLVPCANPDGRDYVQKPGGDTMWRKNRANNPGSSCVGVDLNRNLDFLWHELLGATSDVPCSDVFHGPLAFSEPETRNVRWLLDTYPLIRCFVDVHSYSELILYPWGNDTTQSGDASQNFLNPMFDGLRGTPGGYGEFMPSRDVDRLAETAVAIRDRITQVRGRVYTPQPSVDLYPTTGTHMDYAFSRHRANNILGKVYAFTFETGREFQPANAEKLEVIKEATAGMTQLIIHCICAIDLIGFDLFGRVGSVQMRAFREEVMETSAAGRKLIRVLEEHSSELTMMLLDDTKLRKQAAGVLRGAWSSIDGSKPIPARTVTAAVVLIGDLRKQASPTLKKDLTALVRTAKTFSGRRAEEVLKSRKEWSPDRPSKSSSD